MKDFLILIVFCLILFFSLNNTHFMLKTRTGDSVGYFHTTTSNVLPQVLADYLRKLNIRYSIYILPNYVKDFLRHSKEFSFIYNSKSKYSILIFSPENYIEVDEAQYISFYNKVQKLAKKYSSSFNLFIVNEILKEKSVLKVDKAAYKDLKEYCGYFCLIDPNNDTLFTLKKITTSEMEVLDVIFQQYDKLVK